MYKRRERKKLRDLISRKRNWFLDSILEDKELVLSLIGESFSSKG